MKPSLTEGKGTSRYPYRIFSFLSSRDMFLRHHSDTTTRMKFLRATDSPLLMSGSWLPTHTSTPNQYMQLGLSPRFAKFRYFFPTAKAQFGQACHSNDETTCLRTEEDASLNVYLSPVRDFSFTKGCEGLSWCVTEGTGIYTQIPQFPFPFGSLASLGKRYLNAVR